MTSPAAGLAPNLSPLEAPAPLPEMMETTSKMDVTIESESAAKQEETTSSEATQAEYTKEEANTDAPGAPGEPTNPLEPASENGPEAPTNSEVRSCELCGATQTPMWRRGPSGKGTVCNACGVRWASRRRGSRKSFEESIAHAHREHAVPATDAAGGALEQYYCKYCGLTWPLNYFKNRQQFGAHCSNCSRKRKSRDGPPALDDGEGSLPSSPRDASAAAAAVSTGPYLRSSTLKKSAQTEAAQRAHRHEHDLHDTDDLDDFGPPHKRAKTAAHATFDSGDEATWDSDSETATSPYGPSATSLYRLLTAVENVLTEEREMAQLLTQMNAIRAMLQSVDETRKITLAGLETTILTQLEYIKTLIEPTRINALIEREQAELTKAEALQKQQLAASASNAMPGQVPTVAIEAESKESSQSQQTLPTSGVPLPQEANTKTASLSTDAQEMARLKASIAAVERAENHVEREMGPPVVNPATAMDVPEIPLPAPLEAAVRELVAVFANATLLQLGSSADIDAFKSCFVHVLNQSKAGINQEVAVLYEALVQLKQRSTQLGQSTFIDPIQLRQASNDLHTLKQRVVHSSRAVQAMFVQLVAQFTEQIDAAKRIYQENAGNHVRHLDQTVRSLLSPALSQDVDNLRLQLLTHVNCVHANLAYIDTLVQTAE